MLVHQGLSSAWSKGPNSAGNSPNFHFRTETDLISKITDYVETHKSITSSVITFSLPIPATEGN
jgi:hypothetical protein